MLELGYVYSDIRANRVEPKMKTFDRNHCQKKACLNANVLAAHFQYLAVFST